MKAVGYVCYSKFHSVLSQSVMTNPFRVPTQQGNKHLLDRCPCQLSLCQRSTNRHDSRLLAGSFTGHFAFTTTLTAVLSSHQLLYLKCSAKCGQIDSPVDGGPIGGAVCFLARWSMSALTRSIQKLEPVFAKTRPRHDFTRT